MYKTMIYSNDGTANFPIFDQISGNYHTQGGVYFVDVDGDGIADVFEANYSGDVSKIFFNDGAGTFTDSQQEFGGYLFDTTKASFGDIDNDGDFDLLASSEGTEAYYFNNGSGIFSRGMGLFKAAHISLGDVDNDGDLDVFSGKKDGTGLGLFINNTSDNTVNSVPTQPYGFTSSMDQNTLTLSWQPGSDDETPKNLLTYNLRVGTTPGGNDVFSGVIPCRSGNVGHSLSWSIKELTGTVYYWSVQTIDSGYSRSSWSPEQVYTANTQPVGGFISDNIIPAEQIMVSSDGEGMVNVQFKVKDQEEHACQLHTFEYSIDGGFSWQQPISLDLSGALSGGWTDNSGVFYESAQDWSGAINSFWFDTLSFDVTGFAGVDQSDVAIRFFVYDGIQDSVQPVASELFRVDNEPPSGSIQIDNNETYCTSQSVTLAISSQDSVSMCSSNDGQTYTDWEAFALSKQWDLSSGNGQKTVYVKFLDENGNSSVSSDEIILDTSSPNGNIRIDNGDNYTDSQNVSLTLSSSGAASMCFKNENGFYTAWEPYSTSKNWTLSDGDGQKTVYVKFKDAAGNTSTASDTISLDTTGPSGSIQINDGSDYTTSTSVFLKLNSSGAASMCFSNDNQTFSAWEPFSSSKDWYLDSGDGEKIVYVKFLDAAGNTAPASDTILLDTLAPSGTMSINEADEYTNSVDVTLSLDSVDAAYVCFSNDGQNFTGWESYSASKSWSLIDEQGVRYAYAELKDEAGNIATISDDIIFDSIPPSGNLVINEDAVYAVEQDVSLTLDSEDAVLMSFSNQCH